MTGVALIRTVVAVAREKRIGANAASLAFYAFNVLVALAVLVYAIFALFGTGSFLVPTLEALTGVGGAGIERFFERMGGDAAGRRSATVLALFISVWSSLQLFRAVESVFMEVYGTRNERSVVRRLVDSLLVLVAVSFTLLVMATVGSLFLFRTSGVLGILLGPVLLWASLFVLFLPLFYVFSECDGGLRDVVPGTAVAATGWTGSAIVLRAYVHVSESVDLYGIVGALLLVLTWLYVVGLSVVLGVVLNALLTGRIEADREWYLFR